MNTKKYISLLTISLVLVSLLSATSAFAQGNRGPGRGMMNRDATQKPAVVGTVSAISGNTITVVSKKDSENITTATTFTVDATNAKIVKNGVAGTISSILIGDTISVQGTITGTNVLATTIRDGQNNQGEMMDSNKMMPNVVGKVSSINGSTLTVISQRGPRMGANNAPTTFTVNATSAKILRGQTVIAISNIAVGDTVVIQGTVTGTSVVATTIRDGKVGEGNNDQALLQIQGNGEPIIAGTISTITGSSLTITNNSKVVYTVDVTGAKLVVGGLTSPTISNLSVGDSVIVQGTINGTSVVASSVIDQKANTNNSGNNSGENQKPKGFMGNMMGGIGNFFKRLFGF